MDIRQHKMVIAEKGAIEFPDAKRGEPDNTQGVTDMFIKRDY